MFHGRKPNGVGEASRFGDPGILAARRGTGCFAAIFALRSKDFRVTPWRGHFTEGRLRSKRSLPYRTAGVCHTPLHHPSTSLTILKAIGMRKDVVEAGAARAENFLPLLLLLLGIIKQHEVFLAAAEVKVADGLAVVVVEEYGEIFDLHLFTELYSAALRNTTFVKRFRINIGIIVPSDGIKTNLNCLKKLRLSKIPENCQIHIWIHIKSANFSI